MRRRKSAKGEHPGLPVCSFGTYGVALFKNGPPPEKLVVIGAGISTENNRNHLLVSEHDH